jgi:hypothetical protein
LLRGNGADRQGDQYGQHRCSAAAITANHR